MVGLQKKSTAIQTTSSDSSTTRRRKRPAAAADGTISSQTEETPPSFSFDNLPTQTENDYPPNGNRNGTNRNSSSSISPQALSMAFMKSLSGLCCDDCGRDPLKIKAHSIKEDSNGEALPFPNNRTTQTEELLHMESVLGPNSSDLPSFLTPPDPHNRISPLVVAPMRDVPRPTTTTSLSNEDLMGEYMCMCHFYKVPYNAGILTTLRFGVPSLRVSPPCGDVDVLPLVELLLRHANTSLSYIRRLDFSLAAPTRRNKSTKRTGLSSHGALALAKVLQLPTQHIRQVWLSQHKVGAYGASALFWACHHNPTIQQFQLRKCRLGEQGGVVFCQLLLQGNNQQRSTGLVDVDLSANGIGHLGCATIERALQELERRDGPACVPVVNLEGNLVFPEIMNGITHGLGIILSCIGGSLISRRVQDLTMTHRVSCAIYAMSLLMLFTFSTLYHSFFVLQSTRYVFESIDKCAIYILIAGSYTPFLQIILCDKPIWSVGLLGFIWVCCFLGIGVEAFLPTWKWRSKFSLCLYLGMGWAAVTCLPQMQGRLPAECINLLILGGVGYTVGVPFFVRNNNLDHAIWHLFVLAGSILHWFSIYMYVAAKPLPEF